MWDLQKFEIKADILEKGPLKKKKAKAKMPNNIIRRNIGLTKTRQERKKEFDRHPSPSTSHMVDVGQIPNLKYEQWTQFIYNGGTVLRVR